MLEQLEMLKPEYTYILPHSLVPTDDNLEMVYGEHFPGSPLDKLLAGALVFDRLDGFNANSNDPFLETWRKQTAEHVNRLNSLVPLSWMNANPDYFQTVFPFNGTSFVYDAVMTIGFGACEKQRMDREGVEETDFSYDSVEDDDDEKAPPLDFEPRPGFDVVPPEERSSAPTTSPALQNSEVPSIKENNTSEPTRLPSHNATSSPPTAPTTTSNATHVPVTTPPELSPSQPRDETTPPHDSHESSSPATVSSLSVSPNAELGDADDTTVPTFLPLELFTQDPTTMEQVSPSPTKRQVSPSEAPISSSPSLESPFGLAPVTKASVAPDPTEEAPNTSAPISVRTHYGSTNNGCSSYVNAYNRMLQFQVRAKITTAPKLYQHRRLKLMSLRRQQQLLQLR